MEKYFTKISGTPVVEDEGVRPITTVKNLLVDPETGNVIALVVNESKNLVILPMDVLSWGEAVHVHDRECIVESDEVLRVNNVLKLKINIFGNKVFTKSGKPLGNVYDFSIDTNTMTLKKLFTAKGFLGLFRYDSRIIPAKNIIEILKNKIVVKDDAAREKELEKQAEMVTQDIAPA